MKNRKLPSLHMMVILMVITAVCLLGGCKDTGEAHLPEAGESKTSKAETLEAEPSGKGSSDTGSFEIESDARSPKIESSEAESHQIEASKEKSSQAEPADNENNIGFSFADVSNLEFWFGSGAGAWRTVLTIHEDGTFEGEYRDSDVDVCYLCNFTGAFTEPEKVNDYTYSIKIERMELEQEPDTEETKDGIKYIYSEPYGLEDAEELLFYMPGAPVQELPEGYRSWVGGYGNLTGTGTHLPFYGLYNVNAENGFSSYEKDEALSIDDELADVEQEAAALEDKQATAMTQLEMTEISLELYQLWDGELNVIWSRLNETLDAAVMDGLTEEEREWIVYKENEIKKAGAKYEGGSMRPMVENMKGAELTKARVYELAEYLR